MEIYMISIKFRAGNNFLLILHSVLVYDPLFRQKGMADICAGI